MKTDERQLKELYPDGPMRHDMHYAFAHRFLRDYVHRNPDAFFGLTRNREENGAILPAMDPTLLVQSRWMMMDWVSELLPGSKWTDAPESATMRLVSDLSAKLEMFGSLPGLVVTMPPPEYPVEAFFIAAVQMAKGRARYFTLEAEVSDDFDKSGAVCEWTADGSHIYWMRSLPPSVDQFVSEVEAMLVGGTSDMAHGLR